jgi:hypothetical protein
MTTYYIQKLKTLDDYSTRAIEGKNVYLLYKVTKTLINCIQELQGNLKKAIDSVDYRVKGSYSFMMVGPCMHLIETEDYQVVCGFGDCEAVGNIDPIDENKVRLIEDEYGLRKVGNRFVLVDPNWNLQEVWVQVSYDDLDSRVWFRLLTDRYKTLRLNLDEYLKEVRQ